MITKVKFDFHFIVHDNYKVIMRISEQSLYVRNVILNATVGRWSLLHGSKFVKASFPWEE